MLLITDFVITHLGNLNLTTDDNLIAVVVYVAYRTPFPDQDTVDIVKEKLKENDMEYSDLAGFPAKNCTFPNS